MTASTIKGFADEKRKCTGAVYRGVDCKDKKKKEWPIYFNMATKLLIPHKNDSPPLLPQVVPFVDDQVLISNTVLLLQIWVTSRWQKMEKSNEERHNHCPKSNIICLNVFVLNSE